MYQNNQELKLAFEFVQYTGKNIFLTGKAGTGKTTFLRSLKENTPKRMVVVAPTGVAAINAGGTTIHSMFQLPFGPFLPEYQQSGGSFQQNRFNKEKIHIIRSLELLVIDEISMVRADLLDGIDAVLRRFRNRALPFGGVQLLMIGDLQQLAPVAREEEWSLLREHYDTPYFFSSKALSQTDYVSIELQRIYRQSDERFVAILNQIRDNCLSRAAIDQLNCRYIPDFIRQNTEGYITLTTHNYQAQRINAARLDAIEEKKYEFRATVEGEFPEYSYPADSILTLKKGAQVMFLKNDSSPGKRYFNGKIGKVSAICYEQIKVTCEDSDEPIVVEPDFWENTKYEIDHETKEIKETKIGAFTQYPLKTAWAITIHKSQGLTFEKAIIDANAAFSHGQVYVALSRCKSLEGMVLTAPLSERSIINDQTVSRFVDEVQRKLPSEEALCQAKTEYQFMLMIELFDFSGISRNMYQCLRVHRDHPGALPSSVPAVFEGMQEAFRIGVEQVAEKFKTQIYTMSSNGVEDNQALQDRVRRGAAYFLGKLQEIVHDRLEDFSVTTDNKQARKQWNDFFEKLQSEIYIKNSCLINALDGFHVKDYLQVKAKAMLEEVKKPEKKKAAKREKEKEGEESVVPTTIAHTDLFDRLRRWRIEKSADLGVPAYVVMHQKSLFDLMDRLPSTTAELSQVSGFGKKKIEQYGDEVLEIIRDFRIKKGLPVVEKDLDIEF